MIDLSPVLSWLASAACWLALGLVLALVGLSLRAAFLELTEPDDDAPWCCVCAYPTPDSVGECVVCRRRVLT